MTDPAPDFNDFKKRLAEKTQDLQERGVIQTPETPEEMQKKDAADQSMRLGLRAGSEFIGAIAGGLLIGWGIDTWFETRPLFLIVGIFLGTGVGLYNAWRITNDLGKKN